MGSRSAAAEMWCPRSVRYNGSTMVVDEREGKDVVGRWSASGLCGMSAFDWTRMRHDSTSHPLGSRIAKEALTATQPRVFKLAVRGHGPVPAQAQTTSICFRLRGPRDKHIQRTTGASFRVPAGSFSPPSPSHDPAMKLHACWLPLLALCAPFARAQYYSDGWRPGQPTTKAADAAPTQGFDPSQPQQGQAPPSSSNQGNFVERMLTSGPLSQLFAKTGVNISERLEAAHKARLDIWDQRIPFLTDDNWEELVVNETFTTEEEERERVWFFVM